MGDARGTRRDGHGIFVVQDLKSWKSVRVFNRAHSAIFGYVPNRRGRRVLYLIFAALTALGWLGFTAGYPMLSDRVTPLGWALATASCFVAACHVDSPGAWVLSGSAVLTACFWRATSLVWFEVVGPAPELQDGRALIAIAFAGWSMATIGVVAAWSVWLRPNQ
jgi:hypothetical protein